MFCDRLNGKSRVKRLQQMLIVLGIFVFSYNLGNLIHESGHALNAVLTGGSLNKITMSPLSWCYTWTSGGNRIFVIWGGFLWQTIIPIVLLFLCFKSRIALYALFLALVSFAESGIYMIAGAAAGIGDGGSLVKLGTPPFILITVGGILLLCCLPLSLPIGVLLGIGQKQTSFISTMMVLMPIQMYLLAMLIYNLMKNPSEKMLWFGFTIGGIFAMAVLTLIIYFFTESINNKSFQYRTTPVSWPNVFTSIASAIIILLCEAIFFRL